MKCTIRFRAIAIILSLVPSFLSVQGQMVDPSMDREGEPFSYFSKPTDVIGVMDGKEGTMITPEGYLCTGFGELMFFTGNPAEPVNQRVKTLRRGYLPVVTYSFRKEDVNYEVTAFAATLDGNPESPLMNFVRVNVMNTSREARTAWFSAATRYQNDATTDWGIGDNRFNRPVQAKKVGQYEQAGVKFDPNWEYSFLNDGFLRDGRVYYLFQTDLKPERRIVLNTGYNETPEFGPMRIPILPTTPVGVVRYKISLPPGGKRSLEFRMPYEPLASDDPLVEKLRQASFDDYLDKTEQFWSRIFAEGIDISLPEEKVTNTFKANLVYDLIARNKHGDDYVQKVNEFQYDAFWLRDASYIVRMYDVSGYHTIARQCLDFFLRWQQEDGNFLSQGGQFDGWGQTLWAFGEHVRMTRDTAFAQKVYPAVLRAFDWLQKARASDPLHLVPVTTPGDNEEISGHVTGHNFWALAGLKNAMVIAAIAGTPDDQKAFQREYDDFRSTFLAHMRKMASTTGGYMPPSADTAAGYDWGNMLSVYPEQILDPHDPLVTATLNATRAKYQEGIMTYANGAYLHHYLTMKNTETEVIRGDQQMAIGELYALLVHTSSTHAGFEFSIVPWGSRDFGMNLSPHGWFAAKFRTLLRNMLVREEGKELHFLSCLSPEWVRAGTTFSVKRAPTDFGMIDLTGENRKGVLAIHLNISIHTKPERTVLHIPWFMNVTSVSVDGSRVQPLQRQVEIPYGGKKIEIHWTMKTGVPSLSYDKTVKEYKQEFRKRYDRFLKEGSSH